MDIIFKMGYNFEKIIYTTIMGKTDSNEMPTPHVNQKPPENEISTIPVNNTLDEQLKDLQNQIFGKPIINDTLDQQLKDLKHQLASDPTKQEIERRSGFQQTVHPLARAGKNFSQKNSDTAENKLSEPESFPIPSKD